MNIIQPFDEKSKCPACGWGHSSTTFRGVTGTVAGKDRSYIVRHCARCGHGWRELPLYMAQATDSQKVEFETEEIAKKEALNRALKAIQEAQDYLWLSGADCHPD